MSWKLSPQVSRMIAYCNGGQGREDTSQCSRCIRTSSMEVSYRLRPSTYGYLNVPKRSSQKMQSSRGQNCRGWVGHGICGLCKSAGDYVCHILLCDCKFSNRVWSICNAFMCHSINLAVVNDVWMRGRVSRNSARQVLTAITAICWHIWKERNNKIFRNKHTPIEVCLHFIISDYLIDRYNYGGGEVPAFDDVTSPRSPADHAGFFFFFWSIEDRCSL